MRSHVAALVGIMMACSFAGSAQAPAAQNTPPPAPLPNCTDLAAALRTVAANDSRLKDWPQFLRYREDNRTVSGVDVVFMGDSITDYWQRPQFGPFFSNKRYLDRGISGQTTPQMLVRFRSDVLAFKPKVVVILAGVNDIASNTGPTTDEMIEDNLMSMTELAVASHVKVVLSSITPVSEYHLATLPANLQTPQTFLRPMARIRAVNEWIKTYAAAHGHVYLDYFSSMTDDKGLLKAEFSADDLHPNAAGYAVMAPLAQAAVDQALK
jgi:lysophospholipase L1-like esterase